MHCQSLIMDETLARMEHFTRWLMGRRLGDHPRSAGDRPGDGPPSFPYPPGHETSSNPACGAV